MPHSRLPCRCLIELARPSSSLRGVHLAHGWFSARLHSLLPAGIARCRENVLLLLYSQPTETFDDPVCLATAALVGIDRLPQIAGASVMEEKHALPYTPKRSRSERIRAGASLRDTVRKTFTHVVDQEIGEQVHRLIGQRGARLG